MKKFTFIVVLALVVVLSSGSAFAANSLKRGEMGINVGMGDSVFNNIAAQGTFSSATSAYVHGVINLTGKYFAANDLAVLGGIGLQSDGSDADASYFSILAGVRKYLKVDDFAPFVDGKLTYTKVKVNPKVVDLGVFDFSLSFGAEAFLSRQFSIEGSVGVGFGSATDNITKFTDTYFGTRTVGVSANFYF